MGQLRGARSRGGMTLAEVLMGLTILGLLSVGVSSLYVQAVAMYTRGTRQATARDKAALALERIAPEIREAYNVDFPGPDILIFTLPERAASGHYRIDPETRSLVAGEQVAIFQSDVTGRFNTAGRYVWRAERTGPTATWVRTGVLMDELVDLSFTYAPAVERLELVRIAVTIGRGEGPGYFNRTEVVEVWIRNH